MKLSENTITTDRCLHMITASISFFRDGILLRIVAQCEINMIIN